MTTIDRFYCNTKTSNIKAAGSAFCMFIQLHDYAIIQYQISIINIKYLQLVGP